MTNYKDKTLLDNNRRLLNLQRAEVANVLPEYFTEDFPNLVQFLDAYYDWMEDSNNPTGQIQQLHRNRDTSQVPNKLLQYLEDELLLGQAYFGGFVNKREAIKFSNLLYRSKGTKYSIEQFFRGFYGSDPQVIYPKENIFTVGPAIDYDLDSINNNSQQVKQAASIIGPESQRYLTDDKKYQTMSVLIKSNIPISTWLETYKLFVHPAGAHIAGELVLELVNTNPIPSEYLFGVQTRLARTTSVSFTGLLQPTGSVDTTLIETGDGTIGMIRTKAGEHFGTLGETLVSIDSTGPYTFRELVTPSSRTMDDSDTTAATLFDQDSTGLAPLLLNTMDESRYDTLFDSATNSADSAHYPFQHI